MERIENKEVERENKAIYSMNLFFFNFILFLNFT